MATSEGAPTSEVVNEQETQEMKVDQTLNSTEPQGNLPNGEESASVNGEDAEGSSGKTLEEADVFMEKGSVAMNAEDYSEAAECFSRALEIRVAHYGELAPECSTAYYKYGCALLYKAQEETDPLGAVPKKDASSVQSSEKSESLSNGQFSATSVVGDAKQHEDSTEIEDEQSGEVKDANATDQPEAGDDDDGEGSEDEDEEDESDLDLAWKMLDVARVIVEKSSEETMEKVDILSALGEVALEREDIENSVSDYSNALSVLHRLVESDSREIAEINFRICLALEVGSKPEEAIPYCQKAISVCKTRLERLKDEVKNTTSPVAEVEQGQDVPHPDSSVSGKAAEVETLSGLLVDLEKKLEDLQQLLVQPSPFLSEFKKMIAAKSGGNGTSSATLSSSRIGANSSGGGFDSPTLSTAHTKESGDSAVQHLGVVGRGVKRVSMSSGNTESGSVKKPCLEKGKDSGP